MKKLLFVLAFPFIGQQVFSQMYIVVLSQHDGVCNSSIEILLTKVGPTGVETNVCIPRYFFSGALIQLNQELNNIVNLGYKLFETSYQSNALHNGGFGNAAGLQSGSTFIFTIPWSVAGLEEVATTLKSFNISPNPANTFVDILLDYSLKGESELVFISESGYITHKQSIGNISKNEKYNIDISKITSGKYLVTIVNRKTYTTPQKLIVL